MNGTAFITWFENGRMLHKDYNSMQELQDALAQLEQRIPRAHISWYLIDWDNKRVRAARGALDA